LLAPNRPVRSDLERQQSGVDFAYLSTCNRPSRVVRGRRLPGELKMVATILERPVIEKVLTQLELDPQPPPRAPAREPVRHQAS
jgi:hypothetical protein